MIWSKLNYSEVYTSRLRLNKRYVSVLKSVKITVDLSQDYRPWAPTWQADAAIHQHPPDYSLLSTCYRQGTLLLQWLVNAGFRCYNCASPWVQMWLKEILDQNVTLSWLKKKMLVNAVQTIITVCFLKKCVWQISSILTYKRLLLTRVEGGTKIEFVVHRKLPNMQDRV